jgi:AcrR family transcriptional regulator
MSSEARREMILQAAVPLVIEYGAAVTTSQIARAAGIAEGTVFRAFTDKDELLGACVAEAIRPQRTVAEIAAISLDQPLADRLTEAVAAMSAHLGRMGTLIGALHASGGAGTRHPAPPAGEHGCGPPDRRTATQPTRDAVAELFEPERESLRLPPAQLASLFVALMFQLASCDDAEDEASTADVIALFLHGALAGTDPSHRDTTHRGETP